MFETNTGFLGDYSTDVSVYLPYVFLHTPSIFKKKMALDNLYSLQQKHSFFTKILDQYFYLINDKIINRGKRRGNSNSIFNEVVKNAANMK